MKKQLLHAAVAAALASAFVPFAALAQNIAIVNGKPVPKARMDALAQQMAKSGRPLTTEMQGQLRDQVIAYEVFMQEANKQGLDASDDFKNQMEMARQGILVRTLFEHFAKTNPVTDAEVQAEYDKFVAANSGKEYKARHILVEKEDQAQKILADLKKGETTSAPVKSQFGYHIIRVDDIRQAQLPKLEEVKPQIVQQLQQQRLQKYQEELRAKAKVE